MEKNFKLPVGGNNNPTPPVLTELVIGDVKYNINDKGEAVDTEGKVIKTKEEIEKLKTPVLTEEEKKKTNELLERKTTIETSLIEGAEVELDNEKFTVDKDGNISKDGKVFKTKAELIDLLLNQQPTDEEVNYIVELQKATNFIPVGANNQPVIYENTVAGLNQYIKDLQQSSIKIGSEQYETSLYNKFPILKDVVEHLTLNGSLKDFVEDIDYSKVTVSDEESQQIDLYTKAKLAQGLTMQEITDMVKYLKEDKKLKDAATTSLTYLKAAQTDKATQRAAQVAALKAQQEQDEAVYWSEIDKVFTTKQLIINDKKLNIPDIIKIKDTDGKIVAKSINDFKDYITKPLVFNINGKNYTMTQHDYDEFVEDTKRTPHNDLFDAFRRFVKYDDSQLINANISSQQVRQILKIKSKSASGESGTGTKGKIKLPIN